MQKNIFELLTECATNDRLDSIAFNNEGFRQSQEEIEKASREVQAHGFSDEQDQLIDCLVSAHALQEYRYIRLAYQQGFKDCSSLLQEIGLLK